MAALLLASCTQPAAPPVVPAQGTPYLGAAARPDGLRVLPPPPAPGSPAQRLDQVVFSHSRTTRERDPQRWALASNDAQLDLDHLMADFACALGVRLDRHSAPALYRLLARVSLDSRPETDAVKDHYGRRRPYIGNDAPICVARGTSLDTSASYPSGHTTVGWTLALLLAELAPDRSGEILARGRAFGESRIICGVHWLSDVQAGYLNAAALVAALHSSVVFRADMLQAGREIALARSRGWQGDPAMCTAEAAAEIHSPLFALQP
ncbi:acid phosphatase [Lichenicoccus sp.]|uniref:acid phosphatase n=1 Tax=Lichenicoccus sp. TaxID=2781899 RepID=UPI003D0EC3BD